jgi:hypothetical protein
MYHSHNDLYYSNNNYRDYSSCYETGAEKESNKYIKRAVLFPMKLHDMLDKADTSNYDHIVSWQQHGRSFLIHIPKAFENIVLPLCNFKLTKVSSFNRQLNMYGFKRITAGRDRGGYYHERFLRNKHSLVTKIQRTEVKGTCVRRRTNPDEQPNFWCMPFCGDKKSMQQAASHNVNSASSIKYDRKSFDSCTGSNEEEIKMDTTIPVV